MKTIKVTYRTDHDAKGNPKLVSAKPIIRAVEHHYISGKVSDSSGSTWDVELNPNQKESTYISVKPQKKEAA